MKSREPNDGSAREAGAPSLLPAVGGRANRPAKREGGRGPLDLNRSDLVRRAIEAFTLLELLVVISIIILIAAIAGPVVANFKPNVSAAATRQLLDDLGRARQLAISQHTTVYMIFCNTNFWTDPATARWRASDWAASTNLFDKQLVGYTFVTLHSMGDQPGRPTVHYLDSWRTLPSGSFISLFKFLPNNLQYSIYTNNASGTPVLGYSVRGFDRTSSIPFPLPDTPIYNPNKQFYAVLPYIAFDYLGRVYSENTSLPPSVLVPVAKGSVGFARNPATKAPLNALPSFNEAPPGNSTNAYNIIVVDSLTGRAHLEHAEVQ